MPLYDSLGESAVEYTVNHSETSIIFAEASKLEFLAKAAKAIKKNVKHVVYWGSHASAEANSASVKEEASPVPILCRVCVISIGAFWSKAGYAIGRVVESLWYTKAAQWSPEGGL